MKITALAFLLLTASYISAFCQPGKSTYLWDKIEESIKGKEHLADLRVQLGKIKVAAERDKNDVQFARALYCEMLVKDLLTEDSLYFRNSAFIDSVLMAPASRPALQTMMHLMQARRIHLFTRKSLKFNRTTYETSDLPVSYASLTEHSLDSLVMIQLKSAATLGAKLPPLLGDLNWLSSNADVLLFKPDLEDIAITEQIGIALLKGNGNYATKGSGAKFLDTDEEQLSGALEEISSKLKWDNEVEAGYRSWLNKHHTDPEILGYLRLLVRSAIYESYSQDSVLYQTYERYLLRSISSTYPLVRAACAFQLFTIYLEDGNKYRSWFHPWNREGFYKAMQIYRQYGPDLLRYPFYEKQVLQLEKQIRARELAVSLQQMQMPGQPMLLKASYRNVPKLYYRIIRDQYHSGTTRTAADLLNRLKDLLVVRADSVELPSPQDYNSHAVYIKLDPLAVGNYRLLFADTELNSDSVKANVVSFSVTRLAAIDVDNRVLVLDRKTGFPVDGAKINAFYDFVRIKASKKDTFQVKKNYTSDSRRSFAPDAAGLKQLQIVKIGDTLLHRFAIPEQKLPDVFFSKENYDDLNEYYDEQTELQVYTDRGIYRPGQKVFFKTILVSKDPKTGEMIVFNKNKGKFFTYWMTRNKPLLLLKDAQGRKLDSLKLVPDDYGSFSGTFVLPKSALPGTWRITGSSVGAVGDSGNFRVEEYKRPSYELVLVDQEGATLPGDPFAFRLKARSFAGASLAGLKVRYSVLRRPESRGWNTTLTDTVGYTNGAGELLISIHDPLSAFTASPNEKWLKVNYDLQATATETTGEQAELKASHLATAWQVDIQVKLKDFYLKSALPVLSVSVKPLNKLFGKDSLSVEIYALEKEKKAYRVITDQWKYPFEELRKSFTEYELGLEYVSTKAKKLVFSDRISAEQGLVRLNAAGLNSGDYELLLKSGKGGVVRGAFSREFSVFDAQSPADHGSEDFVKMPVNSYKQGDTATVYVYFKDSTYLVGSFRYYQKGSKGIALAEKQSSRVYAGGMLHRIQFVIPANIGQSVFFQYAYVRDGRLLTDGRNLVITEPPGRLPEIVIEKYRKVLAPGTKETFSVSIKTNNKNTAAQLLTTLYDATLDKLADHTFDLDKDRSNRYYVRLRARWTHEINDGRESAVYELKAPFYPAFVEGVRQGKVVPVFVNGFDSNKLDEVLVKYGDRRSHVAYGFNVQNTSATQISEAINLLDFEQPLVILDGVPYEGKLAGFNTNLLTDILVIKGQDAVALYGARAASGVLVLSTKGKIVLPVVAPPVVKVRQNFNETAFFFPAIYADKRGMYSFSFDMPENVTTWNWKMMAHTLEGKFAYAERQLYTQLKLMVEVNAPRLLYQGDELLLQSRISNLDTLATTGKVNCKVEDAVTGEDLTGALLNNGLDNKDFISPAKGNVYAAFRIKVPDSQLNPLKVVITATGGHFADAEEHVIPVLSKKIFVRHSQLLRFSATDTVVKTMAFPDDNEIYGLGVSIQPKPQSALMNSLPWLANYSYDCAEQVFNKFYANYTAYQMMKSDAALGLAYGKASELKQTDSVLKTESDAWMQTATPWLGLQNKQLREQQQLFELLDTTKSKVLMEDYLGRLYAQQNNDGGMPWFKGGASNKYISAYLMAGFGKLKGALPAGSNELQFKEFIQKLVAYSDRRSAADQDTYEVFARSFWLKEYPLSTSKLAGIRVLLTDYWKKPGDQSLYNKILAILSGIRVFGTADPLYIQSKTQLESVLQLAIQDPVNGLRWKEISDQEQPDVSVEELIELFSIAFRGLRQENELNEGLLKWILTTKSEHHWATTKGTSAAIGLLTKVKGSAVGTTQTFETRVNGKTLSVTDDLLSGKSSAFVKMDRRPSSIAFSKTSGTLVAGNLTWYYFSSADCLSQLNKKVKLSKQLYLLSEDGTTWMAVKDQQQLKIGAKVKVVLSIETAKPLKYVQLEDYRAAAFEPVDKESGQQSQNGLHFYQAVKDTGLQLFIEFIPSGKSEISYELQVVNEGIFTNGPAVLEGLYQPEIAAYSNALQIKTVR